MGDRDRAREAYMGAVTDPGASATQRMIEAAQPGTAVQPVDRATQNDLLEIVDTLFGKAAISEGLRNNLIKEIGKGSITAPSQLEQRIVTAYKYGGRRNTDGIDTDAARKVLSDTLSEGGYSTEVVDKEMEPSTWENWAASVSDWLTVDEGEKAERDYKKTMLTLLRSNDELDEKTYNRLVQKVNDYGTSMDEFEDILREAGYSSDELDDVRERAVYTVDFANNAAARVQQQTVQLAQEEAEYVENGEESAAASTALQRFQILDDQYPSKYKYDTATRTIFTWSDADQSWVPADENGNPTSIIDMDEAQFAVTSQWANDRPEWVRMTEETGINVTEADYFELLHVVENPDKYGADPTRYLPGMPDFLGGFSSTYSVARRRETPRMEDWRRVGVTDRAEADFLIRAGQAGQLPTEMVDTTSRPFYDVDDNWALFAGLSVEDTAIIQRQMIDLGALDAEDVSWGYWSSAEADAMKEWLYVANGRAERWNEVPTSAVREHFEQVNNAAGTGRAVYTAPAYQKMDPARANQTIKAVIRQQLGREPTEDELAQFGTDMAQDHRDAFVADVEAERMRFNANVDEIGDPGEAPADVDYEARFLERFEERNAPELEAYRQGEQLTARQEIVGNSLSNIMRKLGGGIG